MTRPRLHDWQLLHSPSGGLDARRVWTPVGSWDDKGWGGMSESEVYDFARESLEFPAWPQAPGDLARLVDPYGQFARFYLCVDEETPRRCRVCEPRSPRDFFDAPATEAQCFAPKVPDWVTVWTHLRDPASLLGAALRAGVSSRLRIQAQADCARPALTGMIPLGHRTPLPGEARAVFEPFLASGEALPWMRPLIALDAIDAWCASQSDAPLGESLGLTPVALEDEPDPGSPRTQDRDLAEFVVRRLIGQVDRASQAFSAEPAELSLQAAVALRARQLRLCVPPGTADEELSSALSVARQQACITLRARIPVVHVLLAQRDLPGARDLRPNVRPGPALAPSSLRAVHT